MRNKDEIASMLDRFDYRVTTTTSRSDPALEAVCIALSWVLEPGMRDTTITRYLPEGWY